MKPTLTAPPSAALSAPSNPGTPRTRRSLLAFLAGSPLLCAASPAPTSKPETGTFNVLNVAAALLEAGVVGMSSSEFSSLCSEIEAQCAGAKGDEQTDMVFRFVRSRFNYEPSPVD